jgi:hypothetical protein
VTREDDLQNMKKAITQAAWCETGYISAQLPARCLTGSQKEIRECDSTFQVNLPHSRGNHVAESPLCHDDRTKNLELSFLLHTGVTLDKICSVQLCHQLVRVKRLLNCFLTTFTPSSLGYTLAYPLPATTHVSAYSINMCKYSCLFSSFRLLYLCLS